MKASFLAFKFSILLLYYIKASFLVIGVNSLSQIESCSLIKILIL